MDGISYRKRLFLPKEGLSAESSCFCRNTERPNQNRKSFCRISAEIFGRKATEMLYRSPTGKIVNGSLSYNVTLSVRLASQNGWLVTSAETVLIRSVNGNWRRDWLSIRLSVRTHRLFLARKARCRRQKSIVFVRNSVYYKKRVQRSGNFFPLREKERNWGN